MRHPRPARAATLLALAWMAWPGASVHGQEGPARRAAVAATRALDDTAIDAQVREIASSLQCPICEAQSVETSPTELARDMRRVIRDMVARGRSADQIRAYFVSRYGEGILEAPPVRGFNLLAYFLPGVLLAAGVALVALLLRHSTGARVAVAAPPGGGSASSDELARLRSELDGIEI